MKKTQNIIMYFIVLCLLYPVSQVKAAQSPKDSISSTVDAVIHIMKDQNLLAPDKKQERRARIRSQIRDRFDFTEMAKRSLARHWKQRSPEEQEEFVKIFSDLLENSYIGKIEAYTDEKVTYDKDEIKGDGKYGVVNTTIVTKDVNIPIDYKVISRDDKWWVYDVVIEGVSFISTYRSQYDKVIARDSYAKLIEQMKSKLSESNAL